MDNYVLLTDLENADGNYLGPYKTPRKVTDGNAPFIADSVILWWGDPVWGSNHARGPELGSFTRLRSAPIEGLNQCWTDGSVQWYDDSKLGGPNNFHWRGAAGHRAFWVTD